MQNDYLNEAATLQSQNKAFALATVVRAEKPTSAKPGAKAIVTSDGVMKGWVGGSCAQPTVVREAKKAMQDGQPRLVRLCPPEHLSRPAQDGVVEIPMSCESGGTLEVYVEPHLPKPHLVIVGHLPVAESLVVLGKDMGYAVTVICLDDASERFGQADEVLKTLDFSQLDFSSQTYIVIASHGNYDEEAVEAALQSDAVYVSLVASKKRGDAVVQYLQESGLCGSKTKKLKYPAGLDFGAATPEEIALSILAEIVQVRRRKQESETESRIMDIADKVEARDPVCGMAVDIATARHKLELDGEVFYFCCAGCLHTFEKAPENYLANV